MPAYPRLPKPDLFNTYWLGPRTGTAAGPAIMQDRRLVGEGKTEPTGKWIVFMGSEVGFLFAGINFLPFDSPASALQEVNRRLEVGAGKA